jgi:K+-sensing histidine kinase KdpD
VIAPKPAAGEAERHAVPAALLHDLRTPLSQIVGYAELLAERAQEAGDDGTLADLHKIATAGYRILELIEEHFYPGPAPPAEPAAWANGRGQSAER